MENERPIPSFCNEFLHIYIYKLSTYFSLTCLIPENSLPTGFDSPTPHDRIHASAQILTFLLTNKVERVNNVTFTQSKDMSSKPVARIDYH